MGHTGVAYSAFGQAGSSAMPARAKKSKRAGRGTLDADATVRRVLEHLYQDHYVALVRLAALLTCDPSAGQEIAADSLIAVAAHSTAWRTPQDELFGLRQQVVLRCRLAPGRTWTARSADAQISAPGQPEAADDGWESSPVVRALRLLPIRQREVVVLTYYVGLNETDLARLTGSSQRAVAAVLSGVCQGLADGLRDSSGEQPGAAEG
jgi:DNA-directed RNA polymerase specialized sigma24 family protein